MSFGFGFGFTKITAAIRAAFSPSSLFAANEPGVWYDPSDLSTLFQDAAGTTPVTAVEQPVGLMLDKSKGPVLGPELVTNGTFDTDTTGWKAYSANTVISNVSGTLKQEVVSGGKAGAVPATGFPTVIGRTYRLSYEVVEIGAGATSVKAFVGTSSGTTYGGVQGPPRTTPGTVSVVFTATAATYFLTTEHVGTVGTFTRFDNISVRELPGNHARQTTATSRPVLSARVNQYLATETLATQNVTTLAAQYRLRFEGAGTITLSGTATGVYLAGSHLIACTSGTLTTTVSGSVTKADLRVANNGANLPPYQRVNTATDYDTAGFPHYLRFDGIDDWLVTNTITPGTDKAQVFAGVRKLSDAASVIAELSTMATSNRGSFLMAHNGSGAPNGYNILFRGTSGSDFGANGYAAPVTNVLTGLGDISGDSATLRVNGTQAATSTLDQGTGNYLAYPLYIGRRGGTLYPFNGHLYSLIVRFGNNLPIETIEKTENYVNQKTGAY